TCRRGPRPPTTCPRGLPARASPERCSQVQRSLGAVGGRSEIDSLDSRVAVVTGAVRTIGRASAIALADAGARVLVTDIEPKGLAATVDLVAAAHGADRV